MKRINLKSIVPFTLLLSSVGINNNDSNLIMAKSNLNYDSEVTVSSESSDHGKALINDFNYDTYWEGAEANNQSVVLDLLSIKKVTSVTQIFKDEDVWFFTIEASIDGENYFQIVDYSKGAFGRSFEESVTTYARYVRLNVAKSEKGYLPSDMQIKGKSNQEVAEIANHASGVTKAQEAAMLAGSMFGWQTPAADPKNYDEQGQPIRPKQRDRGDAR